MRRNRNRYEACRYEPILPPEEQRELFRRWREERDIDARNRLIACNLPLFHQRIHRFVDRRNSLEDLLHVGILNVLDRLDKYDGRTSVAGYLVKCVVWGVKVYKRSGARLIRIPDYLATANGHHFDAAAERVREVMNESPDYLLDEQPGRSASFRDEEELERLERALATLLPEQRAFIEARFGFGGRRCKKDATVARESGLTKNAINKRWHKYKRILREQLEVQANA